jgi:hypothetical protein
MGYLSPGGAVDVFFHTPRNNLCVSMVELCELDQVRDQQRVFLHQSKHGVSVLSVSNIGVSFHGHHHHAKVRMID